MTRKADLFRAAAARPVLFPGERRGPGPHDMGLPRPVARETWAPAFAGELGRIGV